ncbi:MAG: type VI secretion system tube protein Hcp [Thermoanaerobaculia bacterium]
MKKTATAFLFLVGSMALLGVRTASAQTSTFMLVPGIPGPAIEVPHVGWIPVTSLTQTLENSRTLDLRVKERKLCAIETVKNLDLSGPLLWAAAMTDQVFAEVRIDVLQASGNRRRIYEIKLMNARITAISTTGTSVYAEKFTLHGESAMLSFFPQRPDGSSDVPVTATFACN